MQNLSIDVPVVCCVRRHAPEVCTSGQGERTFFPGGGGNKRGIMAIYLRKLHLPTLTYRRCRRDMIQVFKYLHSMYTCSSTLLPLHQSEDRTTRGHSLKLLKPSPRLQSRQAFFTQRVVNLWNSLPESAVTAPSCKLLQESLG